MKGMNGFLSQDFRDPLEESIAFDCEHPLRHAGSGSIGSYEGLAQILAQKG